MRLKKTDEPKKYSTWSERWSFLQGKEEDKMLVKTQVRDYDQAKAVKNKISSVHEYWSLKQSNKTKGILIGTLHLIKKVVLNNKTRKEIKE